jgi:hypothetical protein
MSALTRLRLDVPEVHRLLGAIDRLVDGWAETEPGTPERRDLWLGMTRAADALTEATYGGPRVGTRLSYWARPYDPRLDARVWRWQRPGPCRVLDLRGEHR